MRQVAEIMYLVEAEREEFLEGALHPDDEVKKALWLCGVRNQQYYALNDFIFMTFEYEGTAFSEDMAKMAAFLDSKGHLIKKRRKDVPAEERSNVSWWAPVKKMASLLDKNPMEDDPSEKTQEKYMAMLDGCMSENDMSNDISFDAGEWTDGMNIW